MISFRLLAAALLCAALPTAALAQVANQRVLRDACYNDALTHCSKVQPGGGRLFLCLDQNRAKLSTPCKAALPTSEAIKARFGG